MSNESENRIDLTQFEGITEGVWFESETMDANYRIRNEKYEVCDVFSTGTLEGSFNAEAIAKLPELIAELKKCYEEIDRLQHIAQDWVKLDAHTDDGKCLILDMEDSDGNCFSGYINRASE